MRPVPKCFEQEGFGAGQPGLPSQRCQLIKQCGAPVRIKVGGCLVQQQQGRGAIAASAERRSRCEDQADEQGLLLAGRGVLGGRTGWPVNDREV